MMRQSMQKVRVLGGSQPRQLPDPDWPGARKSRLVRVLVGIVEVARAAARTCRGGGRSRHRAAWWRGRGGEARLWRGATEWRRGSVGEANGGEVGGHRRRGKAGRRRRLRREEAGWSRWASGAPAGPSGPAGRAAMWGGSATWRRAIRGGGEADNVRRRDFVRCARGVDLGFSGGKEKEIFGGALNRHRRS